MIALFPSIREPGKKQSGTLFHLFAIHIENFRAHLRRAALVVLQENDLRVSIARGVVVAGKRRHLEPLGVEIMQPGEHFHFLHRIGKNRAKSTTNRTHSHGL